MLKDNLIEVKKLIEKGWTKHSFAIDENGKSVFECNPKATCFCLMGAVHAVCWHYSDKLEKIKEIQNLLFSILGENIINWNDHPDRKKEDVLNLLDKGIAQC